MYIRTVPQRLFSSLLPTGEKEFSCYLCVDQQDALDLTIERLNWQIKANPSEEIVLSGTHITTEEEKALGRVPITAFLRPSWVGGWLIAEVEFTDDTKSEMWEIKPFLQANSFRLPFDDQVLILVGHRLGEVHRTAWQIPSQQFAWDILPLDSRGLRLLHRDFSYSLQAQDFAAFGQAVLAPASGRVTRAVDGSPDITNVGELPDVSEYIKELTRAFGNHVILDHGAGVWSFLGHLRHGSIVVKEGQQVKAAQRVGALGNSGFSSGPHLHLQFMDGPDLLQASPLPIALDVEGETYAPQAGEIVSSPELS